MYVVMDRGLGGRVSRVGRSVGLSVRPSATISQKLLDRFSPNLVPKVRGIWESIRSLQILIRSKVKVAKVTIAENSLFWISQRRFDRFSPGLLWNILGVSAEYTKVIFITRNKLRNISKTVWQIFTRFALKYSRRVGRIHKSNICYPQQTMAPQAPFKLRKLAPKAPFFVNHDFSESNEGIFTKIDINNKEGIWELHTSSFFK